MRIAQVSPLFESVPPQLYGGTERIVSYLTEELVKMGHDVTLFASGDSITKATLIPGCEKSLRLSEMCIDQLACHVTMLEKVYQLADRFDIIHFHCDYLHYPLSRRERIPHLTTLHGRLDIPELGPLYDDFREIPVISISNSQRTPLPQANWQATVYHGLPVDLFEGRSAGTAYLAFLGRIAPDKGPDRAIEIAKRVGMELRIAAKVDAADRAYFEDKIKPLLDHPLINFVGEIDEQEKQEFLGNAHALLFPIDWPEPFGLVMIEAMACGLPVVAWNRGSVPEIIDEGTTGYIVENLDQAVQAVHRIGEIRRNECRSVFEQRFSASRMASDYLKVYETVLGERESASRQAGFNSRSSNHRARQPHRATAQVAPAQSAPERIGE